LNGREENNMGIIKKIAHDNVGIQGEPGDEELLIDDLNIDYLIKSAIAKLGREQIEEYNKVAELFRKDPDGDECLIGLAYKIIAVKELLARIKKM
jgi:hypothetical protein